MTSQSTSSQKTCHREVHSVLREVEVAGKKEHQVTQEIKRALCSAPDVGVLIAVNRQVYFSLKAVDLSPNIDGHGLVYQITVSPDHEGDVQSFSRKELSEKVKRGLPCPRITGQMRLADSNSQHWVPGKDAPVTLPFLGEIERARQDLLAGQLVGPPNRYSAKVFRDFGDMNPYYGRWNDSEFIASLSLGRNKTLNEDGLLCRILPAGKGLRDTFLAVAVDGMTGHGGGVAAAGSVLRTFASGNFGQYNLENVAAQAPKDLEDLYQDVLARSDSGVSTLVTPDMGAPFAAVRVAGHGFQALRVGDCRIAHYRKSDQGEYSCVWVSEDQGFENVVYNPVSLEQGRCRDLQLDSYYAQIRKDDYLVVATDGVWKRLRCDEIAQMLSDASTLCEAEENIKSEVTKREERHSRSDNRGFILYRHGSVVMPEDVCDLSSTD
jgi:serine/threonine protein phosphatase PrpC